MSDQSNDEKPAVIFASDKRGTLNGEWPRFTWFQRRLAQVKAAESQQLLIDARMEATES